MQKIICQLGEVIYYKAKFVVCILDSDKIIIDGQPSTKTLTDHHLMLLLLSPRAFNWRRVTRQHLQYFQPDTYIIAVVHMLLDQFGQGGDDKGSVDLVVVVVVRTRCQHFIAGAFESSVT